MSSCLFDEDAMRNKTTFAVHTWYTLLRRMGQANNDIPAESPYAKLSKAHCPNIYHTHMTKLKWRYLPLFDISSIFIHSFVKLCYISKYEFLMFVLSSYTKKVKEWFPDG